MHCSTIVIYIRKLLSHFLAVDPNWSESGIKQNNCLASMKITGCCLICFMACPKSSYCWYCHWSTLAFWLWPVQASPSCPSHCTCQLGLTFTRPHHCMFCMHRINLHWHRRINAVLFSLRFPGMWNKSSCNRWRHRYTAQTSSFSTARRFSSWRGRVRLWTLLNTEMDLQVICTTLSIIYI